MPVGLVRAAPGAFLAMAIVAWVVKAIWPDSHPEEHQEVH
jgi:hypothetical protein